MAMTALSLLNGAATPVAKAFTGSIPFGGPDRAGVWICKEGVSPLAYPRVEISVRRTSNKATKSGFKVFVPYVLTDPLKGPTLVGTALFDSAGGGYIIPDTIPASVVNDLEAYVKSLVNTTVMTNLVRTQEVTPLMG